MFLVLVRLGRWSGGCVLGGIDGLVRISEWVFTLGPGCRTVMERRVWRVWSNCVGEF